MRKRTTVSMLLCAVLCISFLSAGDAGGGEFFEVEGYENPAIEYGTVLSEVTWLGNAGLEIDSDPYVIYIDPYKVSWTDPDGADFIFITHMHQDHFDPASIAKLAGKKTVIIVPKAGEAQVKKLGYKNIIVVEPEKEYKAGNLEFYTVQAYNVKKERASYHPKGSGVGYVINGEKAVYYIAGDTDMIPEMEDISADVAFLPVGGTYTMTADEAVQAAMSLPDICICVPYHYGSAAGTGADADKFLTGIIKKGIGGILMYDNF